MTSTTIIKASDFSNDTTDVNRHTWTPGTMRMVSEALAGQPVAITVDRQTGHTMLNVRLGKVLGLYSGGQGVQVTYTLDGGGEKTTNFWLPGIGDTIIPMGPSHSKWDVSRQHLEEKGAAIAIAMATDKAAGCQWGRWDATVHQDEWHVTYTPHLGNPQFVDKAGHYQWWPVSLTAVRASMTYRSDLFV
jgi:hypothetical protein